MGLFRRSPRQTPPSRGPPQKDGTKDSRLAIDGDFISDLLAMLLGVIFAACLSYDLLASEFLRMRLDGPTAALCLCVRSSIGIDALRTTTPNT